MVKKCIIDGLTVYSKKINETEKSIKDESQSSHPVIKNKAWFILGLATIVLTVSGALWFVFIRKPTFLGEKVGLKIEIASEATLGAELNLSLEYSNNEDVVLENVEIKTFWPEGFIFLNSDPRPKEGSIDVWELGQVEKGTHGKISIQGKLLGEINSTKNFKARLSYKPQNVTSYFFKEAEAGSKITSTALNILGDLPENLASEAEVTWTIKYTNIAKKDIEHIKIEAFYPEGFEFHEASPKPTFENRIWENLKLKANQEAEIKIKGRLTGHLDEIKVFKASIGQVIHEKFWLHQQIESSIKIIKVGLKIEPEQSTNVAGLGDLIEYKIVITNTGRMAIDNLKIINTIDPNLLDTNSIQVENGKFDGEKLIWDKKSFDKLESLKPEEMVTVGFKVNVVQEIKAKNPEEKNFIIKNKTQVKGEIDGKENYWEGEELTCKITTSISLTSQAFYVDYEGIQVGSGPIPPEVGKTTKYVIYWQIGNQTNEVQQAQVISSLPYGVTWTGKTTMTMGHLEYDPMTKRVVWKIDRIPAYSGSLVPGPEATFEVSITPKEEDVGKILLLLNDSRFSAKDSFTATEIVVQAPALDTSLPFDVVARGKGKVVKGSAESCPACRN